MRGGSSIGQETAKAGYHLRPAQELSPIPEARAVGRKLEHKRERGLGSEEEGILGIGDPTLLVASLLALSVEYQTGYFGIEGHVITRIEIEWPQTKAGVNENR